MQVRVPVIFIAISCATIIVSWGQQPTQAPSVAVLLRELHSNDLKVKVVALGQLRAHRANLQRSNVRTALIDLLDQENHDLDSRLLAAQSKGYPDEGDHSQWAEYYSDLVETVDSFVDWNDSRQACILVGAASSDDSAFAAELADHANVTIPCLIKRSQSTVSMNRAVTIPVLVQALAKVKGTLDSETLQAARNIVLAGLQDQDEAVRVFTVNAVGKYGGEDFIPSLSRVAETDLSPEIQGHSVRKEAVEAIAAIRRRAEAASPIVPPRK
jgi:hypothetical protein